MPPHWSTWTLLQGYSHTLDIFRWLDGVSTGTGFNLYGTSLTPLTHPLTDYFSWRCSPKLPIINQISDETLAARIRSTCLTRTVPHKICAAARINVSLFTESKATRNPTTVVSDPSQNPNKQYGQLKVGNVKYINIYIYIFIYIYIYIYIQFYSE